MKGQHALVALSVLLASLVASLPRTPVEVDEVRFLRAVTRYDVAAISPYVFIGLRRSRVSPVLSSPQSQRAPRQGRRLQWRAR